MKIYARDHANLYSKVWDEFYLEKPNAGFNVWVKNKHNMNIIAYSPMTWIDDQIEFKSEQDYFLFLMKFS